MNSKITRLEFTAYCVAVTIDPAIALENDNVAQAIKQRNRVALRRVLQEEF